MRISKLYFSVLLLLNLNLISQTEIPNGGFENWENLGTSKEEPTHWSSNKTGGGLADVGPQTCGRESNNPYAGSYCLAIKTKSYLFQPVNGAVTTGRIEAPSMDPEDGYVHTIKNQLDFNSPFTGRPDSLVGFYKYVAISGDNGKVEVLLHGDYDVQHPNDPSSQAFIIGTATFNTPTSNVSNWTRFSVPFTYYFPNNPSYILSVLSSSGTAGNGKQGSTLWIDELEAIYNPTPPISSIENDVLYFTKVDIFPNPAGNYLNILMDENIFSGNILITNMFGENILKDNICNSNKKILDLSGLTPGIYFIKLDIDDKSKLLKFIKL